MEKESIHVTSFICGVVFGTLSTYFIMLIAYS